MRVVIAGAGSVGRSIARELLHNGHQVLLIDKDADDVQASRVPDAAWLLADACEISVLEEAKVQECDVVVAATGDDKANLVVSLLSKTEFGVPAHRRARQQPQERVDVRRVMGRGRRRVDPAADDRSRRGGGQRRRPRADLPVPAGAGLDGRADHARGQPLHRAQHRRDRVARRHRPRRHHPRRPTRSRRAATTRSRRTTSCCSSRRRTARTRSRRCSRPGYRPPRDRRRLVLRRRLSPRYGVAARVVERGAPRSSDRSP